MTPTFDRPARLDGLSEAKAQGRPLVAVTAYDFPAAQIADAAGVDIVFVGDSVGTNVLGYETEREVTMSDIRHHLRAVRRGVQRAIILADLPFRTYETPESATANARLLVDDGADLVKLEGGLEQVEQVRALKQAGIAVCGHIGFTPQTLFVPGQKGRVQGRLRSEAEGLLAAARGLEAAGVLALVLELVPEALGTLISRELRIPCIGIGAGRGCDGQVLIFHDVVGMSARTLKLARSYGKAGEDMAAALGAYTRDVRERKFPGEENVFEMDAAELPRV